VTKRRTIITSAGIIVLLVVLSVLVLEAQRQARIMNKTACASNLCHLAMAAYLYMADYDKFVPESLQSLYRYVNYEARVCVCPSDRNAAAKIDAIRQDPSRIDELSSYRIIGGYDPYKLDGSDVLDRWGDIGNEWVRLHAETILIYEVEPRHAWNYGLLLNRNPCTHHNVAFLDVHRESQPAEVLAEMLTKTKQAIARFRSPADSASSTQTGE